MPVLLSSDSLQIPVAFAAIVLACIGALWTILNTQATKRLDSIDRKMDKLNDHDVKINRLEINSENIKNEHVEFKKKIDEHENRLRRLEND